MDIVGLGGVSGSGKSTVAGMLATQFIDQGYTSKVEAFGLPLYDDVRQSLGGGLVDKRRDRPLMQCMADEKLERDPLYLISRLVGRHAYEATVDFLIVSDVRRMEEAEFCRQHGRFIYLRGRRRRISKAAANHASETGVAALEAIANRVFTQQPTLDRLRDTVRLLAREIITGKL